jgi:hypothetical protein
MAIPIREMHAVLLRYFAAEKQESLLFVAAGVAALAISAFLLRGGGPYRGMILPLAAVALIQLGVGGSVYLRTDRQVAGLSAQLERVPAVYRSEETARMEKVLSGFRLYKTVEIALLAAGIGLALLFPRRDLPYSAGIGLVSQASLMLVLDLFAERRAREYLDALAGLAGG